MRDFEDWTDEQVLSELRYLIDVGAYNSAEFVLRELAIRKERSKK